MSILDRLNLLVRSEFSSRRPESHDTDRASARSTLREAADALRVLESNEAPLRDAYERLLDRIDRLDDAALDAVRRGDDDTASRLLAQKESANIEARALREQLDRHQDEAAALRAALRGVRARVRAAAAAPPPSLPTPGFDAFDARTAELEAELDAAETFTSALDVDALLDPRRAELDREFQSLRREERRAKTQDAGDALSRLRNAMNKDANE